MRLTTLKVLPYVFMSLVATLFLACSLTACSGSGSSADENAKPITVSVRIDGTEGERGIIYDDKVTINEGGTVYDALVATGVNATVKNAMGIGTYVAGIDGLMEKEKASTSGWTFKVNGEPVSLSSDKRVVEDGDTIEWLWRVNALEM